MTNAIKNHVLQVLVLAAGLLAARASAAQSGKGDETERDGWVPVKHLSFTPEDIEGGLLGPEGELIEIEPRAAQPSLIEIRGGFEAEVVKTMENL